MFGCIYQLWDWLEAPPLFSAATMDAKKLQQLQQSQNVQKKIPLAYQTNIADYRTATHSPVFQQQQQQHGNYHMSAGHHMSSAAGHYQQSPTTTSSSGGGPLSPIDIQPQANKLLLKHQLQNSSGGSSIQSSPYHQASISSGYPTSSGTGATDQLYQSPTERTYLQAAGRLAAANTSALALQQQYQQIQQAKLQAQIASQNEAIQQQQRNFAMRQAMNAAVPQGHYHMSQQASQQQQQQRAPPSSLNLTNQFQPASGPLKVNQQNSQKSSQQQHYHQQQQQQQQQQEQIYGQHQHQQLQMQLQHQQQMQQHHHALQQRSKSDLQTPGSNDQSPIYIQQNHPGHVVNQAVQTQISTVAKTSTITKTPSSEDSSSASAKSPTHAPLDRKKSAGGGSTSNAQALKSPTTKRPPNSPVTISGWLYKQGSEGLKVWRKRWFVLAEYCLYYYKSPEEEKVLGSILLPSYKVSACLPEDKIYRKFAFKCEHQNMRTYWLAAENAESMVQWVRALSAATMMQAPSSAGDSSEHPSGSSSVNHSGDNSDSGINTLQSKMSGHGQVTPASDNGGGVTASSSNSGGGAQPLYANAPPKPRRITDGGYSSPSPEHSVDNERTRSNQAQTSRRSGIMSPTLQQMQQHQYQQQQQQQRSQHHAIYDTRTGNVSSAIRIPQPQSNYNLDNLESQYQQQLTLSPEEYPSSPLGSPSQYMDAQMEQQIMQLQQQRMAVDDIYGERELYMQRLIQQRYPPNMAAYGVAERRTPDAYGRSKNRIFSDYEDIYNLAAVENAAQAALLQEATTYRRPMSPPSYEDNKYLPTIPTRYTPNHLELTAAGSNLNLRSRPAAAIVRPHSADFLEYEARAEAASDAAAVAAATAMIKPDPVRAPRPKSSLDINRTPDSFYYSEENYAEKMRKSALYLQNPQAQPQQAAGSYRIASGSTDFLSPVASGMNTIGYENPYERIYKRNELLQDALGNQAGHTSIPRMSRSQTMGNGAQIRSSSTHPHHPLSPTGTYQQQQQQHHASLLSSGLTTQQIIQQNEQFLRSASARLPKRSSTFDEDPLSTTTTTTTPTSPPTGTNATTPIGGGPGAQSTPTTTTAHLEGERKREESMKRLLEWKQRMLQSPLTRKSAQHVSNNSATAATQSGQTSSNGAGGSGSGSATASNAKSTIKSSSNMTAMAKLGSNPNILLTSTTVASGTHHTGQKGNATMAGTSVSGGIGSGSGSGSIQRSRSESQANTGLTAAGYNSYSSDDEAGTITKAPAGRSSLRVTQPPPPKHSNNNSTNNNNNNNNNNTQMKVTTTNTIPKSQVSSETYEQYPSNLNSNNDNAIIRPKRKTITINDMQAEQQQQQQQRQRQHEQWQRQRQPETDTEQEEMTSSFAKTLTTDRTGTQQQKSILKPILKTKIINVKPAINLTANDPTEQSSNIQLPVGEEDQGGLLTNFSLPKIPNAIEITDKAEQEGGATKEPTSPQISSYVPVYNTKTVTPSKPRTLSSNYEYIEIQTLEDGEKVMNTATEDCEKIKSETEAIQDAEATPMLMNLKRFKEKEEQRLQFELKLEKSALHEEDEMKTPTQDTEDAPQIAQELKTHVGDVGGDEEEEEDTTCEYTDDDLDEALAEEADVEEEGLTVNISQSLDGEEEISQIYENEPSTPQDEQAANLDESHYLPMTPKKIETDSETTGNVSSLLVSMLDLTNEEQEEENHYVEMTKQLQEDDSKSNYEIMCIGQAATTSISGAKPKQQKMLNEPLYMELQGGRAKPKEEPLLLPPSKTSTLKKSKKANDTLKKKSKKSQQDRSHQKRKDLPDILKPSQSSMVLNSDSSDADDESSKHMDSKKMRSRSRFSLSDTFRPASYYLGASTPLNDCIESSDSEIVSPPPIPNSPPPMEELKTEEIFSAENYDTVKRRDSTAGGKFNLSYEQLPKMHASNTSLNMPKNEAALKSSRLSLPDHFRKVKSLKAPQLNLLRQHERTLSDSNYSFQTDNSSNTSSDFDLYNKLKQNSPSFVATPVRYQSNSSLTQNSKTSLPGTGNNSESDTVELRHRQGSDSELERQRSRRPLSEESISEIESLSEKFEDALETADLDTYLNNLQNSDVYVYHNTKYEAPATSSLLTDAAAAQGAGILTNLIKPPKIFRNHEDEHFYGNIHFVSSTDSLQKMGSEAKEMKMLQDSGSERLGAASLTPVRYMTPLHSRNNSNISEQSAPYYYSELSSSRELLSTPTTLNNQRDIHAHGSNIDHIHNPIERPHNINMDLLADKDQAIDSKNLYKMKTNIEKLSYSSGKNLKTGEPFQRGAGATVPFHLQQLQSPALKINNYQTKNLMYQQSSSLASASRAMYVRNTQLPSNTPTTSSSSPSSNSTTSTTSPSSSSSQQPHTIQASQITATATSASNATKVDVNAIKNINLQKSSNALGATPGSARGATTVTACNSSTKEPNKSCNNIGKSTVLGNPVSGELLWEEDTLWRESLRRVSQRHARSLDDLDRIVVKPVTANAAIVAAAMALNRSSPDYGNEGQSRKPRLTRDVTYVNDNVSQHLRSSFKLRHSQVVADQRTYDEVCPDDNQSLNEDDDELAEDEETQLEGVEMPISTNDHDVYVQLTESVLAADDVTAEMYEVLRDETASNISSNKSAEIDRETIRQWDSMSSGLMKNSLINANNEPSPTTSASSNVKSIIDQLNANCDNNDNANLMNTNK